MKPTTGLRAYDKPRRLRPVAFDPDAGVYRTRSYWVHIRLPTSADVPCLRTKKGRRGSPWLSANDRDHWGRRKALTKFFRDEGARRAGELQLPSLDRIWVFAWVAYGGRRILDPGNYTLTAKAILDGFVDAKLVPDDNNKYVTGPDMRRDERLAVGMTMQIIPLESRS